HRAKGFNMRVLYYDPQPLPREAEEQLGATRVDLGRLIAESDFISIHVPLTQETHHLFSTQQFNQMKRNAVLVNTSRGPVVDEAALVEALKGRKLAGAGLDVYGTILDMQLRLDPRDVAALGRIVSAGVTVVACTGRPFPGAVPWVTRLGLQGPIVCYQGAEVRTPEGGVLLDHGVPHDLAMEVIRYARERNLHVQAYRDDRLMVEHER